jgi:hypothetical protein
LLLQLTCCHTLIVRDTLIDVVNMAFYLSASEAASELGVSVATLYAYVSRGMIRSESRPGSRNKLYRADDVRALRARHVEEPRSNADPFIPSGLESHLTLISNGRLFYRGLDVEELAQHAHTCPLRSGSLVSAQLHALRASTRSWRHDAGNAG